MSDEQIHAGYLRIHDRIYGKMSILGKWWHRQFCSEAHE